MKRSVVIVPEAIEDIERIHGELLRRFGKGTADRAILRLIEHCQGFELFPERGVLRLDLRPDMRLVGYRRMATIAFRVETDKVSILRIFASGRRIDDDDFS